MNTDTIQGQWKQMKGKALQKWGQLTSDDLDRIDGKQEELVGLIQEKYGYARERAEEEVRKLFN